MNTRATNLKKNGPMLNSVGMGEDFLLQVIVEGYLLVNNFVRV